MIASRIQSSTLPRFSTSILSNMAAISVSVCPRSRISMRVYVELTNHWLHELQNELPAGLIHLTRTLTSRPGRSRRSGGYSINQLKKINCRHILNARLYHRFFEIGRTGKFLGHRLVGKGGSILPPKSCYLPVKSRMNPRSTP